MYFQVGGLVSNTYYWFRIRGCTVLGCGAISEPLKVKITARLDSERSISTQTLCEFTGIKLGRIL